MSASEVAFAYFRVAGEVLPLEEITSSFGLEPSECWRKGDPGQYTAQRSDSGWCLRSPLPSSNLRIDEHIAALLPILEARREEVRELGERFETFIVCVGHYRDSSPGFFLSKNVIGRLGVLGLSLDCDLYFDDGPIEI
jgi:hypothetical protein